MATQVDARITVYDSNNQPEVGVDIHVKMLIPPPLSGVYSDVIKTYISGLLGVVDIPDMFVDATYAIWRTDCDRVRHKVDVSQVDPLVLAAPGYIYDLLPPIIGNEIPDICNS